LSYEGSGGWRGAKRGGSIKMGKSKEKIREDNYLQMKIIWENTKK